MINEKLKKEILAEYNGNRNLYTFDGIEYRCDWKGYQVYEIFYSKKMLCTNAQLVLVKNNEYKFPNGPERDIIVDYYNSKLYKEELQAQYPNE